LSASASEPAVVAVPSSLSMLSLISSGPLHGVPFRVQRPGVGQGVRIERDDAVQRRPGAVDRLDPGLVGAHQRLRRHLACRHVRLQAGDRCLHHVVGRARRGRHAADQRHRQPDPADRMHPKVPQPASPASHDPRTAANPPCASKILG
jgi:hypothetical protein